MSGQAAGDGMDAEADVDAALAQLAGEFGDAVLSLSDGHAVAGGDDHRVGLGEQFGNALGGDLAVLAVVLVLRGAGFDAEAAGDDGDERAVHRLAHDVGQVGTGGADQGAGDDQQVVVEQEARGCRGPSAAVRQVAAASLGMRGLDPQQIELGRETRPSRCPRTDGPVA